MNNEIKDYSLEFISSELSEFELSELEQLETKLTGLLKGIKDRQAELKYGYLPEMKFDSLRNGHWIEINSNHFLEIRKYWLYTFALDNHWYGDIRIKYNLELEDTYILVIKRQIGKDPKLMGKIKPEQFYQDMGKFENDNQFWNNEKVVEGHTGGIFPIKK